MRNATRIVLVLLAMVVFSFGLAWAIVQIPGVVPPCQNKGFGLSAEYTGPQIINGRHVQCFAGQIVKVGR
jgi:cytochrome c oxidase assembly protein Cox11